MNYAEEKKYDHTEQPLESRVVKEEMWIGGRDNMSFAVPLVLQPLTNTGELIRLYPLLSHIHAITIRPRDFDLHGSQEEELNTRLNNLTSYVHQLMELRCLQHQKNEIHDAVISFFELILKSLKPDAIPQSLPGSGACEKQSKLLSEAIIKVRKVLYSNDIHVDAGLPSLIRPTQETLASFKNLPQSLNDFDMSLDIPAKWVKHIGEFEQDPARFSQYAFLIQLEIYSLHHDRRPDLFKRIKEVANVLRSHVLKSILPDMFEDIASGATSPDRLERVNTYRRQSIFEESNALFFEPMYGKKLYDDKLSKLKTHMSALVKTKNADSFAMFRRSLTSMLEEYPERKKSILQGLEQHLSGFQKTQNNFDYLKTYIDASLKRIDQPLSESMSVDYSKLISRYDNQKEKSSRAKLKSSFLDRWMQKIVASPERTYGECFDEVKRSSDHQTIEMLNEPLSRIRGHYQHFKKYVHDANKHDESLISSEPSVAPVNRR